MNNNNQQEPIQQEPSQPTIRNKLFRAVSSFSVGISAMVLLVQRSEGVYYPSTQDSFAASLQSDIFLMAGLPFSVFCGFTGYHSDKMARALGRAIDRFRQRQPTQEPDHNLAEVVVVNPAVENPNTQQLRLPLLEPNQAEQQSNTTSPPTTTANRSSSGRLQNGGDARETSV